MINFFSSFIAVSFFAAYLYYYQSIFKHEKSFDELRYEYVNAILTSKNNFSIEDEYALKAAFVYRFTEYIEWGNPLDEQFFYIAILNESGITAPLQAIADTKTVAGKKIVIKEYHSLDEISSCNILFVSKNSTASFKSVVSKFGGTPTLIITEHSGYGKHGAHINFVASV